MMILDRQPRLKHERHRSADVRRETAMPGILVPKAKSRVPAELSALLALVVVAVSAMTTVDALAQTRHEWQRGPVEPLLVPRRQPDDIRDRTRELPRPPRPNSSSSPRDRRAGLPMCNPRNINLDAPNGGRCVRWGNPKRLERQMGPGAPCILTVNQCTGWRIKNRTIYL
jgi:hypothetical protein